MNYEKLTVDRFAENLKEGKYKILTGARRAIGKTGSWSAKEKEKAHALANAHFNTHAPLPTPATKGPKVVAAKTSIAAPKSAKKQARKAFKKAPAAPKEVETPDIEVHASPAERPSVRKPVNSGIPTEGDGGSLREAVNLGKHVLEFFSDARTALTFQQSVNPGGDYTRTIQEMDEGIHRSVSYVSRSIPKSDDDGALPPARVAVPREEKVSIKPKPAPIAAASTVVSDPIYNGTGSPLVPSPVNAVADLTPEEQKIANDFRNATPASTIAALPRPISTPG